MSVLLFLVVVLGAGAGGFAIAVRLGLEEHQAWVAGRAGGLLAVALPAWWSGVVWLRQWRLVGAVVLVALAGWGLVSLWQRRALWRRIVAAEGLVLAGFVLVLLMRLSRPEIQGQEKPMDLGILASLLRAEAFPPPDMWLAGKSLPYYYWGSLVWTVPLEISGVELGVGYNLVAALLGGLVFALAWTMGRTLAGSAGGGWLAACMVLVCGTPDGLRQVLAGVGLTGVECWPSSRQIAGTITEFPLFTLWLGDLHPHLLSLPLALLAMLLALHAGRNGASVGLVVAMAAAFGATWAANPWAMPATLVAVCLLLLCGDGRWNWPVAEGLERWLAVGCVAVGGAVITSPFHLSFHPPWYGLSLVHAWTPVVQLSLYAGCLLLPVVIAVWVRVRGWFDGAAVRRQALALSLFALVLLAAVAGDSTLLLLLGAASGSWALWVMVLRREQRGAAVVLAGLVVLFAGAALPVSGLGVPARPVLVMLSAMMLVLAVAAVTGRGEETTRPAAALAALGVFMLLIPEVLYVKDTYGEDLHRMNTVFKSFFQAWVLLAVSVPALLFATVRSRWRRLAVIAVMMLPGLPHLAGVLAPLVSIDARGLDGLAWLMPEDRAIVRFLRAQPAGTSMIEAVGDSYSDYGRLSAASGVPALLGWANHELVWRGGDIAPELERRRHLVARLFVAVDEQQVRRLVAEAAVDLVVIGSLERRAMSQTTREAIRRAGEVVFEGGGALVVRFPRTQPPTERDS